jgi:hypothetical protein
LLPAQASQPLATGTLVAAGMQNPAPSQSAAKPTALTLPNAMDSVKFMAMGDNGTGDPLQYETARQMVAWREMCARW